jgi:xylulokinase
VADGAARQAAWALTGELPRWPLGGEPAVFDDPETPGLWDRYREAAAKYVDRR